GPIGRRIDTQPGVVVGYHRRVATGVGLEPPSRSNPHERDGSHLQFYVREAIGSIGPTDCRSATVPGRSSMLRGWPVMQPTGPSGRRARRPTSCSSREIGRVDWIALASLEVQVSREGDRSWRLLSEDAGESNPHGAFAIEGPDLLYPRHGQET